MSTYNNSSERSTVGDLIIRPFQYTDQNAAKDLILQGLGERFGTIKPDLNPDLNNIHEIYVEAGFLFVVCEIDNILVGTGALIREKDDVARIVRVSVDKTHRNRGIGRAVTDYLIKAASTQGYEQIVVETNEDWFDAIRLYQRCGFKEYDRRNGEIHMVKSLIPEI